MNRISIVNGFSALIFVMALFGCATPSVSAGGVGPCEIWEAPEKYLGRELIVSGSYSNEMIYDDKCGKGIWLILEDTEESPMLAEMNKADEETALSRDPTWKVVPAAIFRVTLVGTYERDPDGETTGTIYVKRILSAKRLR